MTIKKVVNMKKYDEISLAAAAERTYAFCTEDENWYIITNLGYGYHTFPLFTPSPCLTERYFKRNVVINKEELLRNCKVYDIDTLEDLIELLQTTQEIN